LGNENKRIAEVEILLKVALEENERLRAEIAALKAEIAVLKKDSSNSSKPPSSDIVKPPKKHKGKGKQRVGAQKGHKQHLRKPFDATEVDKIINLTLEICPDCGGALQITGEAPKKHQQVELIEKPYIVVEYQRPRYFCSQCQCYHEPKLPTEVKRAGLFGHSLIALAAYLKGKCHLSYKTMQSFFTDVMSLKVSTGFLAKQVNKASKALAAPYNHLVEQLSKADHLHSDETGSKENGKSCWVWCFRGKDNTVFHIAPTRSSDVLEKLLSKDYNGIISSDFHCVYKKFKRISKARLQLCWAHLIREVKFLADYKDNEVSPWGKNLLEEIRKMFRIYHRQCDLSAKNWQRKMLLCQESILTAALCQVPRYRLTESLSARFRDWHEEYFRFIDAGLPPTNNLCEQSLRSVVIDRKITQGTRSDWGNQWSERIWTVLATCKQRDENVLSFLRSCVGAFLQGFSPPLLLVQQPMPQRDNA